MFCIIPLHSHAPGLMMFSYVPEKTCYFPQHAEESAKAIYLKYKLQEYVKFPRYQKRGRQTFCNVFARDILDDTVKKKKKYCFYFADFRYDLSPVFPKPRYIYMNIQKAYKRAIRAAARNQIIVHSSKQAQKRANKGKLIWGVSAKYNHEFLICPGEWSRKEGCWVAQAGEKNGIFRISAAEVFGKNWNDPEIMFYEFKERNK